MKKITVIVSRVFEPMIMLSLLLVVGSIRAGLMGGELVRFLATVFAVLILPAVILRFFLFHKYRVDWDIRERKKRIVPLLLLLVVAGISLWTVQRWNNPILIEMFVVFCVWLIGFFVITLFWKISGHTGIVTLTSLLLLEWYGWQIWPILIAIPLVTWARVSGKNHTLGQAVGGIVYSTLLHVVWQSILR